jgi:hypothetical protein
VLDLHDRARLERIDPREQRLLIAAERVVHVGSTLAQCHDLFIERLDALRTQVLLARACDGSDSQ